MRTFVIGAVLLLCGCSHELGYAGKNPGAMECKGKATVTIQGGAGVGAGVTGTELNAGSIIFDCGPEGAYFRQGLPEIVNPAPAVKPAS